MSDPIPHRDLSDLSSASALPAVPKPVPKELLAMEFQSALVRLAQKYGAGLRVKVTDPEWVEISVDNLSPADLQAQLQNERNVLFGSAASRVQVIAPGSSGGGAIYLHLLSEPQFGASPPWRGK